jgi:hypothetical protein
MFFLNLLVYLGMKYFYRIFSRDEISQFYFPHYAAYFII